MNTSTRPANPKECMSWCMDDLDFPMHICNMAIRGVRNKYSKQRQSLYWMMRHTLMLTGAVPSYCEIAAVTGAASHSVVIVAVRKMDRKMAAAVASGAVPVIDRPLPMNKPGAAKMKGTR